MKLRYIGALVVSLFAHNVMAQSCIGDDYEQPASSNVTLPTIRITPNPVVLTSSNPFLLGTTSTVAAGGTPFYYWCVDQGTLSKDNNYPNYDKVLFTPPANMASPATVYVRIGDGFGHIADDSTSISVQQTTTTGNSNTGTSTTASGTTTNSTDSQSSTSSTTTSTNSAQLLSTSYSQTIAAGNTHNCVIKTDGSIACWGSNSYGQTVPPTGTFTQVSSDAGVRSCAIKTDGSLVCWGEIKYGTFDVIIPPVGSFTQVSAGRDRHACAIRTDGSIACWGYNGYGQTVPPAGTFTQVSAGSDYTCAISKNDGSIKCWGYNNNGEAIPPVGSFIQMSATSNHSCAVRVDGKIVCWGVDGYGKATPPSTGAFTQVSTGDNHTCALKTDGSIECWGYNSDGQATPPADNSNFIQVSAGTFHTCALKTSGNIVCWGDRFSSQTFPPANLIAKVPTKVANSAPNAAFTLNPTTGTAPLTVSTQNSSSDPDPGGSIAKYEWKTSDNQVSTAITPSFTFANAGDYTVTLTVTDDKGAVTNSTAQKVTVSAMTASNQLALFSDTFSGYQLDTSKWEVTDPYNTIGDTYEIQDNKLRVLLPGGTDGYMGKPMSLVFSSKYTLPTSGDISVSVTMDEINRAQVNGYKDNSGGYFCLSNKIDLSHSLCIGLMGNYSGYNPDGLKYPGWNYYNTYTGHRIFAQVANNGNQTFYTEVKLPELNKLYSYDFKIYRHQGVWSVAYKETVSTVWNSKEVTAFVPTNIADYRAMLYIVTGDGGYTSKTGSVTVDLSQFLIEDASIITSPNPILTVNKPSNGEVVATNITCGTDCTESYVVSTPVTLTAKPATNFVVDSWTGCVASADKQTCQVTMDTAKTVSVSFVAANQPPTASFTATPAQNIAPSVVTLDASLSTDPEGKTLTYEWTSQPALSIPAEKAPKLTLSQAGTYTFNLIVKDDKGLASEKVSKTVTVAEIPKVTLTVTPPVNGEITATNITCGTDCTESYMVNTPVTLTAKPSANFVVDSWTGCVASADKQTCQVTMDIAKTVRATFKPSNSAPTAEFKLTPTSGTVPLQVEADASLSKDADGSIVKYEWETSAGDKITSTTARTFFTFRAPGSYTVTLKVTDNQKVTTISAPQTVTVNPAPVVKAGFAIKAPVTVCVGTPFEMTVRLEKQDTQPIDAAQIALNFDPSKLQIDSVTNSGKLDFELDKQVDNAAGSLSFIAGVSDAALTQSFDIITLKATAKASSEITFAADSIATSNGNTVQVALNNQALSVENCLDYKANLQRKLSSPDVSWQTDLKVSVGNATTAMEFATTSDNTGKGTLTLNKPLTADDYICAKSATTLANRINQPFGQPVDFGTLWEGDANDDNLITVKDFSIFNNGRGIPGDKRVDFNRDGQVDTVDQQLLQANFNKKSNCTLNSTLGMLRRGVRDGNRDKVGFAISALPTNLQVGESFNVTLRINATETQPVAAGAGYINFNPTQLQVNSITPGTAFDVGLESSFDNTLGEINFAAGVWDNPLPVQQFEFITINFKLLQLGGEQSLSFSNTEDRQTELATNGEDITARGEDGQPVIETATPLPPTTESTELHGIATDATGKPLVGATVQVGDKTTVSDDSGYWQIVGLSAADEHFVTITHGSESYTQACAVGINECRISMATSPDVNQSEGQYTLYGTARNNAGKPQANVTIQVNDRTTLTNAAGKWEINGLPEGDYIVKGTAGNFLCLANISTGNQLYRQEAVCKQQSSLKITAESVPNLPIYQGEKVSYAITVTNGSSQIAQNVILNIALSEGAKLSALTAEGGECDMVVAQCTWSSLPAGTEVKVNAAFDEVPVGLTLKITVNADGFPTDEIVKVKTVKPYLSTAITCTPREVPMLSQLHCSITAELSHFAPELTATGVQLRFTPSKGTEIKNVSAAHYGECRVESGTVVCDLNDLGIQDTTQVSRAKIEVDLKLIDSGLLIMTSESRLTAANYPEHRTKIRTPIVVPKDFKVGLVLGIDTTNSMDPYLNGIIKGFEAFIQESATKMTLPWMVLLDIKDDVRIAVPPTQDANVILTALRNLKVGSGGTCPEASAEAFHFGADFVADNGVLAIATNAPPYPETDIDALKKRIGELYDRGVVFHLFYRPECDINSTVEQGELGEVDISTFPTTP